ncbi:urea carboxylase-associated family protein [Verminephrobacter eiseniae]|uniref:urea amidolyase associated protein UAAP1 n=1 Tax=Verminephrobacter eiseniae TaxID=364317 RepID=UPI002237ECD1|nr:urea amidolyase associated protein UAAP1 [Verminephrobacter eiseniae]MCW5259350.1 urea carboxylase-associated family protein [Verminephrobacter eiseniae]
MPNHHASTEDQAVDQAVDQAADQAVDAPPSWQRFAPDLAPGSVLCSEIIPGGGHWSWRLSRGTRLRFGALGERANCALVLYAAHDHLERYNMPDTCKALHTAHLTRGHVLMSDMGRAMASITQDSLGWHDPFGALLDTPRMQAKYGRQRFETQRNAMHRSGRDGLLIEIGKYGLSARDLITPVNLFSRVVVDHEGRFDFDARRRVLGHSVELRCDLDLIVALSCAPHPLDPRPDYAPGPLGIAAWRSGPAAPEDFCRNWRPQCARAMHNSDVFARC